MMQSLLEFGFGVVLVQFVSHECAHLEVKTTGNISGEFSIRRRLESLVNLALKWYLGLSLVFFLGLGCFGQWFLTPSVTGVDVYRPWWILCVGVGLSVAAVPLRCFLEGSNQVFRSQKIALAAGVAAGLAGWSAILMGAKLYALAVVSLITAVVNLCLMIPNCWPFLKMFRWNSRNTRGGISWRQEFWPQQWRIGLSWLSGYLMYQSFVPIAFRAQGAVVAGQLGVTLQIYNAINLMAGSFLTAAGPRMGILGARKDYEGLKQLVRRTWLQCLGLAIIFSAAVVIILTALGWLQMPQVKRFAPWSVTLLFLFVVILQQLANVETTAVRFQKKDPFVINSLVGALLILVCNIWIGKTFGLLGVSLGFALVMAGCLLPWCHQIYSAFLRKHFQAQPLLTNSTNSN